MKPTFVTLMVCVALVLLLAYDPIGGRMFLREWLLAAFAFGGVLSFLDVLD